MFKFPFSTLHELNLDWILGQVKKFSELITPMENAVEEISELEDDVAAAKDSAEQAVEDATNAVATAEEAKEIAEQAAQGVIADGAVITQKLADGAVTYPKLAPALQDKIDDITVLNNHKLYPTGDETDRSAEIMAKLNAYGCCELTEGDYYIADTVIIPNRSTLKGCGKNARIFRTTGSTVNTMLATTGTAGNITIKDIYIVGSNTVRPAQEITVGEIGLSVAGSGGKVVVDGCNFYGINCVGIQTSTGLTDLTSVMISNCMFQFCGTGIRCAVNGEYANVSNSNFLSCYTGALVIGGNNKFANCGFDGCHNGFSVWDDGYTPSNDGHGSAVGCSFNHNGYANSSNATGFAITIENINYGYVFSGCNIFDGDVYIYNSSAIMFDSCIIMGVKTGTALHSNFALSSNPGVISITNCCSAFDAFTVTKTGANNYVFQKNNRTAAGALIRTEDRYHQFGFQAGTSAAAGTYSDTQVSFPVAFPSAPYVFITPVLDSTSMETGKIQFFTFNVTATGFSVRLFNNATIERGFNFNWVAQFPE